MFLHANEHLAVKFVELGRGGSRADHLRGFFVYTVLLVSAFSQSHNFNTFTHFAFCLFVRLIKLKCTPHPSHH